MSGVIDLTARLRGERDELASRVRDLEMELRAARLLYDTTRDELDEVRGQRLAHGDTGSAAPVTFVTALRYGAHDTALRLEMLGHRVTLVLGQDGDGTASPNTEAWAWDCVELLLEEVLEETAVLAGEFVLLRKPLPDPVAALALRVDGRLVAVVSTRTRRQALRVALRAAQSAGEAR